MSENNAITSELSSQLCARAQSTSRELIAIAGPPGSGKSTLADKLCDSVNETLQTEVAVVLPMDGFHLDNALLDTLQSRSRKGAPHTFDVDGFNHLLQRVALPQSEVIIPVFDRELDLARAGGRCVQSQHKLVLVEGNYLLLDQPGWRELRSLFAYTIYLDVSEAILQQRLTQRWLDHGLSLPDASTRAESNDLPNARLVAQLRLPADTLVKQS